MKIALCQMVSGEDTSANLEEIRRLTELAAEEGAKLAILPEFALHTLPSLGAASVAHAEPVTGPFVSALSTLARDTGVVIVAGMLEAVDGDNRCYNTLVVVTPGEGLVASYRKTHLYDAFGMRESDFIRAGDLDGPVTFTVGDVVVGMLTCYDLRFPEAARQHADAGVDLLVYPAAWAPGPHKIDHWNTLVRARAIENTLYVAAVSQGPPTGTGGSLVVDPMGVALGEVTERSGIATAEISPRRVTEVRTVNPSLQNRRFAVVAAERGPTVEQQASHEERGESAEGGPARARRPGGRSPAP